MIGQPLSVGSGQLGGTLVVHLEVGGDGLVVFDCLSCTGEFEEVIIDFTNTTPSDCTNVDALQVSTAGRFQIIVVESSTCNRVSQLRPLV